MTDERIAAGRPDTNDRAPNRDVDERASGYQPRAQDSHARAGVGHEQTDVRVWSVVAAATGLLVVLGFVLVVIQLLFQYYAVREARRSAAASPLAGAYGRQAPPEPRLQTAPAGDLSALRAAEDAALHGYGWIDQSAGVARIPIERAIDLLAERGLPARSDSTSPAAGDEPVRNRPAAATTATETQR